MDRKPRTGKRGGSDAGNSVAPLQPFSFPVPFDIIFCRNVAIHFTEADKVRLFKNIGRCLAKDGCLIIGATESITGLCPKFEAQRHLRGVFYQLKRVG